MMLHLMKAPRSGAPRAFGAPWPMPAHSEGSSSMRSGRLSTVQWPPTQRPKSQRGRGFFRSGRLIHAPHRRALAGKDGSPHSRRHSAAFTYRCSARCLSHQRQQWSPRTSPQWTRLRVARRAAGHYRQYCVADQLRRATHCATAPRQLPLGQPTAHLGGTAMAAGLGHQTRKSPVQHQLQRQEQHLQTPQVPHSWRPQQQHQQSQCSLHHYWVAPVCIRRGA